ncbi:MAG: hypothetical protein KBT03_04105 [Bacteroidales bacterium]|nr:hypothetical protein [Candidatus Scybalousia scybalohippi]
MEKKKLRQVVLNILTKSEKARANDNELIYQTLKAINMPTGYAELRLYPSNIASSITRERNYCLKHNPSLQPKKQIVERRKALQQKASKEYKF